MIASEAQEVVAPRIFFRTPLAGAHCGTLNEAREIQLISYRGNDPEWTYAEPGEVLDVSPAKFEDPFLLLRVLDGPDITAIELWTCKACKLRSPAYLRFRARTSHVLELVGAEAISKLTTKVLDAANYITRRIEEWNPLEGEDEARIQEIKRQL